MAGAFQGMGVVHWNDQAQAKGPLAEALAQQHRHCGEDATASDVVGGAIDDGAWRIGMRSGRAGGALCQPSGRRKRAAPNSDMVAMDS